jgi:hypothetical protein
VVGSDAKETEGSLRVVDGGKKDDVVNAGLQAGAFGNGMLHDAHVGPKETA